MLHGRERVGLARRDARAVRGPPLSVFFQTLLRSDPVPRPIIKSKSPNNMSLSHSRLQWPLVRPHTFSTLHAFLTRTAGPPKLRHHRHRHPARHVQYVRELNLASTRTRGHRQWVETLNFTLVIGIARADDSRQWAMLRRCTRMRKMLDRMMMMILRIWPNRLFGQRPYLISLLIIPQTSGLWSFLDM